MTTPEEETSAVVEDSGVSQKKVQHQQQPHTQQKKAPPQQGEAPPRSSPASETTMEADSVVAPCLVARIDNARTVYNLLKAIHFKDRAVCVITPRGFKFTVEDAKSVQAHSYLQER